MASRVTLPHRLATWWERRDEIRVAADPIAGVASFESGSRMTGAENSEHIYFLLLQFYISGVVINKRSAAVPPRKFTPRPSQLLMPRAAWAIILCLIIANVGGMSMLLRARSDAGEALADIGRIAGVEPGHGDPEDQEKDLFELENCSASSLMCCFII